MGRIFKIAVFGVLAVFIFSAKMLSAQTHPRRDSAAAYAQNERIKERVAKIKEKLGLTSEQSDRIGEIIKNSRTQMNTDLKAFENASNADRPEALLNLKRDKIGRDSAVLSSLTPEQKEKLNKIRAERMEKLKERRRRVQEYLQRNMH
jgi:Spy/CpxP family protein refolding chaperone